MQACGAIKLAIPITSGKPIEPQASQSIASLIPPPTKEDARKRSVILDRQVSVQWHGWPQWQEETTRAGRPATFRGLALYARSAPINGARHRWLAGLGGGLVHQFARPGHEHAPDADAPIHRCLRDKRRSQAAPRPSPNAPARHPIGKICGTEQKPPAGGSGVPALRRRRRPATTACESDGSAAGTAARACTGPGFGGPARQARRYY